MDHNYAEALEQQLSLLRYLTSTDYGNVQKAVTDRYGLDATLRYRAIQELVERASPYYWSPSMSQLVQGSAATLDDWTPTPEQFTTPFGYFWFAKPLYLPVATDTEHGAEYAPDDVVAFCWGDTLRQPEDGGDPATADRGFLFVPMLRTPLRMSGQPGTLAFWTYGKSIKTVYAALDDQLKHPLPDQRNFPGDRSSITLERTLLYMRYFAAAVCFTNQVLDAPPVQVPRSTRRRLERVQAPYEPVVRVVQLRRKRNAPSETFREIDWSCSWVVRGHWRQQWYPSLGTHQPRWITPYTKGDPDKPLKAPGAKVFAVVR